jgi:hypothetical protein
LLICVFMEASMRSKTAALVLAGLFTAAPLSAHAQGRNRAKGIPPGHLPPPGLCRVWYDGTPPGHQPPSMSCREAERIAARDRNARVIYGGRDGDRDRDRDRDRDSRYPERYPYPDRSGYPDRYPQYPNSRGGYGSDVPYSNGYKDGFDQGRSDARSNRSADPVRQGRYRSADRGYNSRYGTKEQYKVVYRDGYRAGYDEGYRDSNVNGSNRPGGGAIGGAVRRLPWPF